MGGGERHQLDQPLERDHAAPRQGGIEHREGGFQPYDAHRTALEAARLFLGGVRRVVGGDHVDRAVAQALEQRVAVGGGAQRRVHLEAAVLLQIVLAQREVVRRGFAGDVHAALLRRADQRDAFLRRDVADVIGAFRLVRQLQVALDRPPFALGDDAAVIVRLGIAPRVNVAAVQQRIVLAVRRDDLAKRRRARHGLAHDRGVLHAASVVGKRDDVRGHALEIGDSLAPFADGQRAVGKNLHACGAADHLPLNIQRFNAVGHGIQIGHGAHGRKAAVRRGQRARADRFLIRKARLTQMHMNIHETGQ